MLSPSSELWLWYWIGVWVKEQLEVPPRGRLDEAHASDGPVARKVDPGLSVSVHNCWGQCRPRTIVVGALPWPPKNLRKFNLMTKAPCWNNTSCIHCSRSRPSAATAATSSRPFCLRGGTSAANSSCAFEKEACGPRARDLFLPIAGALDVFVTWADVASGLIRSDLGIRPDEVNTNYFENISMRNNYKTRTLNRKEYILVFHM